MAFGSLGTQVADGLSEPCGWHFYSLYPPFECLSVLRFSMVIRKNPDHDHPLLFELPYGLNFEGLVCTVIFDCFGVLML